jgi:hypothetical protein
MGDTSLHLWPSSSLLASNTGLAPLFITFFYIFAQCKPRQWYFVPLVYYCDSSPELRSPIRRTLEVDSGMGKGSEKSWCGRRERA